MKYRHGPMASSISGLKAHKKIMLPMMCDQLPCMNDAVTIVIQWCPATIWAGTADHVVTNASPPISSSTKTKPFTRIMKTVTTGMCAGRRDASPNGIMVPIQSPHSSGQESLHRARVIVTLIPWRYGPRCNRGSRRGTLSCAPRQLFELIELPQRFESPLRLMFIHYRQCEAYVNQNVISDTSFGRVVQADVLGDAAKVHLAAAQAEVFLLNDGHDFPGHSQAHATTSVFELSSGNSLTERNFAIIRRHPALRI